MGHESYQFAKAGEVRVNCEIEIDAIGGWDRPPTIPENLYTDLTHHKGEFGNLGFPTRRVCPVANSQRPVAKNRSLHFATAIGIPLRRTASASVTLRATGFAIRVFSSRSEFGQTRPGELHTRQESAMYHDRTGVQLTSSKRRHDMIEFFEWILIDKEFHPPRG